MRLTSNDALKLIESERKNIQQDRWINHSICVGNIAGRIAEALKLDSDYAKTLGYIHDISSEYSIYEKIINLCDLMCTTKILTVDKRMMDLLYRHGVYVKTHYHIVETLKLKEHFDNLLGYNLYDLFSEIKENL